MKKFLLFTLCALVLSACSTIDRITYYSPISTDGKVSGPKDMRQGFVNFDAEPDKYKNQGITITVANDTHPYFFGPWFVTVIPVFPISWLADIFIEDNLKVQVYAAQENYQRLDNKEYYKIILNGKEIAVSKLEKRGFRGVELSFPITAGEVDSFVFVMSSSDEGFESIKVQFKYTSRWRWKQYVVNG